MLPLICGLLLISTATAYEGACREYSHGLEMILMTGLKPECMSWETFDVDVCLGPLVTPEEGLKFCECLEEFLEKFDHDLEFSDYCHDRFEETQEQNPEQYEERHGHHKHGGGRRHHGTHGGGRLLRGVESKAKKI
jgi:hypothetical protein